MSYPERFAVDRAGTRPALRTAEEPAPAAGVYYDPYGWGWYGHGSCYSSLYCDPYGYYRYDMGYGRWPFGYDRSWFGGYWGQTFIVVRDRTGAPGGTVVNGQG